MPGRDLGVALLWRRDSGDGGFVVAIFSFKQSLDRSLMMRWSSTPASNWNKGGYPEPEVRLCQKPECKTERSSLVDRRPSKNVRPYII